MSIRCFLLPLHCFLIMSFLNPHHLYAQDIKELTVSGGLMYKSWVESESSITCGLILKTPTITSINRYPLQVVLVIDASRSMVGEALQNAKASAKIVLNNLSDKDMFGIITYSGYARIISPLQPLNINNRRTAMSAIGRIKHENKRNLSEGLKKAAEQFSRFKGQRSSGHYILLLTNGNANEGITDPGKLLSLAESLSKKYDIRISTFGYDRFYDENFLIDCASKTGGRAYFVEEENVNNMSYPFNIEIIRISKIYAHDVTIEIVTPSSSSLENIYGGSLQDQKIIVGDIKAAVQRLIFFDIVGRPSRRKDIVVNVDYVEPVRLSTRKARMYLDIPLGKGDAVYDETFASALIEFSTMRDLAETIDMLRDYNKKIRIDYAEKFYKTVKQLEQLNVAMRSSYLAEVVERFKKIKHDLENAAIEGNLITKKIKYQFLELLYGK